MTLSDCREKFSGSPPLLETFKAIESGQRKIEMHGLAGSLAAFLLSDVRSDTDRQIVAALNSTEDAEQLRDDLETLIGEDNVRYMPDWELLPFEEKSPHVEVAGLRTEALNALLKSVPVVVVTTARAMARPVMSPATMKNASFSLEVGDELSPEMVVSELRTLGFERDSQVLEMGQFALRGGILDIFTFGREQPVRLEFFGDEIESIREFDPATQRSSRPIDRFELLPRRDLLFDPALLSGWDDNLAAAEKKHGVDLSEFRSQVRLGVHFDGVEHWMPIITGANESLFSYLDDQAILFIDDMESLAGHVDHLFDEAPRLAERANEKGRYVPLVPYENLAHPWQSLRSEIDARVVLENRDVVPGGDHVEFGATDSRQYEGSLEDLREDLASFKNEGGQTLVVCDNQAQAERLFELLEDVSDLMDVEVAGLHAGFTHNPSGVRIVTENEIFSRYRRRHRYRKFRGAVAIDDYMTLTPGDVMVHEDHGIGVYQGIKTIGVESVDRDCLEVRYRGTDRLFVPAEQIGRIKNYTPSEDQSPVLSKLGGTDWDRLKDKTRKAVATVANDLVQLYAKRAIQSGYAFPEDSSLQRAMEAAFSFEETRDQRETIESVRSDMEQPTPMDRLVCGDVGFGKTEVAIRAAFKAAVDGKQTAILVPTTVLADQHWRTFSERLAEFPVKVGQLSRFVTPSKQKEALDELVRGQIDIVIGTHRLLSKDVEFKDLGLVVIDEEHRFGVKHKERLKSLRTTVDVMTLTATPIPRTLHMALSGVRDMSVISTPLKDRLPVHTEIITFDEDRIAEAILREVDRDGQVFFVHNRVQTIEEKAEELRESVPGVTFRTAHGQMGERALEEVMLDFVDRKFDCLVTTLIIQSGLDMPNVNTILIDRADTFGLAELYQLRGRVGRSDHRAFAYLMLPPDRKLRPQVRKRLRAIEEYSDLGSGFKVAMRDMEIRGAGNLLGHEQSGLITTVGFEMYAQLLDEAIMQLRGEQAKEVVSTEVDTPISAYLPDTYIVDPEQKMRFYQRLADATTVEMVRDISEELRDTCGRPPEEAEALLGMAALRVIGSNLGALRVGIEQDVAVMTFESEGGPSREELMGMVGRSTRNIAFRSGDRLRALLPLTGDSVLDRLKDAVSALSELAAPNLGPTTAPVETALAAG